MLDLESIGLHDTWEASGGGSLKARTDVYPYIKNSYLLAHQILSPEYQPLVYIQMGRHIVVKE